MANIMDITEFTGLRPVFDNGKIVDFKRVLVPEGSRLLLRLAIEAGIEAPIYRDLDFGMIQFQENVIKARIGEYQDRYAIRVEMPDGKTIIDMFSHPWIAVATYRTIVNASEFYDGIRYADGSVPHKLDDTMGLTANDPWFEYAIKFRSPEVEQEILEMIQN